MPTHPGVLSWADLLSRGREQEEKILQDRLKRIAINQCSTLVFTSGTTGNPKGVMLSHDNMTWNSLNCTEVYEMEKGNTRSPVVIIKWTSKSTLRTMLAKFLNVSICFLFSGYCHTFPSLM